MDDGGGDEIENAIPVCFECHAEIHGYNDKHPRGRKFLPDELRLHKEQWLKICAEQPTLLITTIRNADVGPLQALIDELDFNMAVADIRDFKEQGCKFCQQQFLRAINEGSISLLRDNIRQLVLEAYRTIGAANTALESKVFHPIRSDPWAEATNEAQRRIIDARTAIAAARSELLEFLSSDSKS